MISQSLDLRIEHSSPFRRFDWNFAAVILTLQVIGLVNLYSAAYSTDHLSRVFYSQLMWIGLGWVGFILISSINYRNLLKYSGIFYFGNVTALFLVLLIGKKIYGSRRWLDLGFFNLQPSETMKLFLILFMAYYLARNRAQNLSFKDLLKPGLILGVPFLLTAKQPDLGTALLLLAIPSSMILFLKVQRKVLLTMLLIVSVSVPLAWNFALKTYQKDRGS